MLVAHDLKLLFAHVPKTAGSSITAALRPHLTPKPGTKELPPDADRWAMRWHGIGWMHGRFGETAAITRNLIERRGYRVGASIRNPFARFAALWAQRALPKGIEPWPFLTSELPEFARGDTAHYAGPNVDDRLVVRFESLDQDWRRLCATLDIEHAPLPHVNRKPVATVEVIERVYSEPRCIRRVHDLGGSDFERYGYSWDPGAALDGDGA